jgi:hypothetical protein
MTENEAKSLLTIAGFHVGRTWELPNGYWPRNEHYAQIRADNPWWLVQTEIGPIQIGWRKRVISIDWGACSFGHMPVRGIVTEDDVTKEDTLVHAYTMAKAVEYLTALRSMAVNPKKRELKVEIDAGGQL